MTEPNPEGQHDHTGEHVPLPDSTEELFHDLAPDSPEKTRWPGTPVKQASPDESAEDAYVKQIQAMSGAEMRQVDQTHNAQMDRLDATAKHTLGDLVPRLQALGSDAQTAGPDSPMGQAYLAAHAAHEKLLQNFAGYLDGRVDQEEIHIGIARVNTSLGEAERLADQG